ncbi:MAG: hypothetical protein K0S53_1050 [Bacteroidetes bacterium]|jgi:hypothetical protein|nr:hypothetical protein [Bacteroidota bacterium]
MKKYLFFICVIALTTASCDPKTQEAIIKTSNDILNSTSTSELTTEEIIRGLKEALSVGTSNSTALASQLDGFNKNPLIFIPWPAQASSMKEKLIQIGFQKQVSDFETSLNRAAEEATKDAAPIFIDAITQMTISDGLSILNGKDTAATHYLRMKTYSALKAKFSPVVSSAISKVNVTAYWTPLVNTYNLIPGVTRQNPDLNAYVTDKTINALMTLIAREETKIRHDPAARVTEILKKVFGAHK